MYKTIKIYKQVSRELMIQLSLKIYEWHLVTLILDVVHKLSLSLILNDFAQSQRNILTNDKKCC